MSLVLATPLRLKDAEELDPSTIEWPVRLTLAHEPQLADGPVLVPVTYRVDRQTPMPSRMKR